jgi:glycosyltransferase involved in cell wall biosynthesis
MCSTATDDTLISVIVPAHNEAKVIERCLRGIIEGAAPGELEVIVVCNGCTDATAERARRIGPPVQVLQTPVASKVHALNLGDGVARGFPRFYIDADIVVSLDAIRRVADVLRTGSHCKARGLPGRLGCVCTETDTGTGPILAAAPRMHVNVDGSSWPVRAFYDIWTRLPYCQYGMIGSGVYALSRDGRRRFGSFPKLISDDGYVRLLFGSHERASLACCSFEIKSPRNLSALIRIKTRSQFGKYELRRAHPELLGNDPRDYHSSLASLLRQPWLWPRLAIYCFVLCIARIRSLGRFLARKGSVWDRDESCREPDPTVTDANTIRLK